MTVTLPVDGLAVELGERALAFVLSLLSAPTDIAGLDDDRIGGHRRDELALARGREALADQGHVRQTDAGVDVDPRLLLLCAVAAAPEATVGARAGDRAVVYHAASGQIVEIVRTAVDRYVLGGIGDVATVVERVTALAGLDGELTLSATGSDPVVLGPSASGEHKHAAAALIQSVIGPVVEPDGHDSPE